jgi:crotonobetainyl-CoA:carnitine CoA-transferase CaiB-like acyl-CoA transferase
MRKPLAGCRVLDLGIITAGAATSGLLADLGAEVIKIESPTYRDPFRLWISGESEVIGGAPLFFRSNNRSKQGISVDLKSPEGRDVFFRLATRSDVVVENFRRGVMERLGLSPASLHAANPDLIVLAISSQGGTGPDAGQVSYGSTLEAVGGFAWITGYAGGPPMVTGKDLNYPDQAVAIFAAGMVIAAWIKRRRGHGGSVLDVSQRELTTFLVGESFAEGPDHELRIGNADPFYVLQDCFRGADGAWVAVSILPADRQAISSLLGLDPSFDETELRSLLATWIAGEPAAARADALAKLGIAAAPVLDGRAVLDGRGKLWTSALIEAADGMLLKGTPFQFGGAPAEAVREAPAVGEHSGEVLQTIAGYTPEEVAALVARGVVELLPADDQVAMGA